LKILSSDDLLTVAEAHRFSGRTRPIHYILVERARLDMTPGHARKPWWRSSRFFGLSVLAHVAFITFVARACDTPFTSGGFALTVPRNTGPMDVTLIEPTVLNPYVTRPTEILEMAEVEKKVEEARKQEENRDISGQVVDQAKPDVEIRPDDSAKFLSEYDNKVEKETKGRIGDGKAGGKQPRKEVAMASRPSQPRPKVEAVPPQPAEKGQGGAAAQGALAMRSRTKPTEEEARGKDEGMTTSSEKGTEARQGETPEESPAEQGKGAPGENRPGIPGREGQEALPGSPDMPQVSDLTPSDDVLASAVGGGTNDYLKDVDEGTDTLLNTKRWKYASFFTRVKHGVAQSWRPDAAYRLRDPTGQIYGHKNRFTVLKVSLRPDGSLRDVLIEKGCGVDFLDDEAITAFRDAQPFPNPPPGLVDPDSKLITFRFGFYFEIVGTPTFKIFRQ